MNRKGTHLLAVCASLVLAASANAMSVGVAGHSFESPDCDSPSTCDAGTNSFTINDIDAWTVSGTAGVFDPDNLGGVGITPTDGDQFAFVNEGMLTQTVGVVQEGKYTLTVDVGRRGDRGLGFPGFAINLLANGVSIAGIDQSDTAPFDPNGEVRTLMFMHTVGLGDPVLGQALGIKLTSLGAQTLFDDVRLDHIATPLPASGLLFVCGMATAAWIRRRLQV